MKKAASIFLLTLFLFNIVGYKCLFYYLAKSADERIEAKIKNFNEQDQRFITLKIPLNLPYITDWKDFESMEGEITIKGSIYKFVKKKVFRDTLILLCIDHKEKSLLEKNDDDYFKKVNDLASNSSKKSDSKQLKTDYYLNNSSSNSNLITLFQEKTYFKGFLNLLSAGHYHLISAPPESYIS